MLDADLINAWDGGDWTWYIRGHDPSGDELYQIDDPESLLSEALWMRPIRASQCDDFGVFDEDSDDTVLRNPTTGKFEARMVWIECHEQDRDAEPWTGVRYKPGGP